jgi:hypothetical protein
MSTNNNILDFCYNIMWYIGYYMLSIKYNVDDNVCQTYLHT